MITYVSTSCIKTTKIKEAVETLYDSGFKNIELSGGTDYYENIETDLLGLKKQYNLCYLCHNYFPPPKEHFVLNLASLNDETYKKSLEFYKNALKLCETLESPKFALHAGYYIDIKSSEIGKRISRQDIYTYEKSTDRYFEALQQLRDFNAGITIYVENNVFSDTNRKTFPDQNPFMLTHLEEYLRLRGKYDFQILLDLAHLKVSCRSLGLDFQTEAHSLLKQTDYVHISDNDALHDQNLAIKNTSDVIKTLKKSDMVDKTTTLEIYEDMEKIKNSFDVVNNLAYPKVMND